MQHRDIFPPAITPFGRLHPAREHMPVLTSLAPGTTNFGWFGAGAGAGAGAGDGTADDAGAGVGDGAGAVTVLAAAAVAPAGCFSAADMCLWS